MRRDLLAGRGEQHTMINLYDILEAADGQLFGEPEAQIFTDFCFDWETAEPGDLYVALKTEWGDGHQYMEDAVARGVTGIMCTIPPSFETDGLTVIVMRHVEDSLLRWAQMVLQKYGTAVVAVTGTEGRASAAAAIAGVLKSRYPVYTHPGGLKGRLGLPLALGRLTRDHRIAVLEFGIERPGEMAAMVAIAHPIVAVVTALTPPEGLGTADQAAAEARVLVRALLREGLAVLNFDDPAARDLAFETVATVITLGLDLGGPAFGADVLAYNIIQDRYKTGFDVRRSTERFPGRWVPFLGTPQLGGALAGLAVGLSYDVGIEEGLHALTELEPLPGIMHPLEGHGGCLLIDDSGWASAESALTALDWLKHVRDERGRVICVLGDLEAPVGYATLAHNLAGQRAAQVADRLVTCGDLAAEAGRVAQESGLGRDQVAITFSVEDAAVAVGADLGPHDVVWVKGQRMNGAVRRLLADDRDVSHLARQTGVFDAVLSGRQDRPSWVQIDLEAIAYNTRRLKGIVGEQVTLMAVVSDNAYGHDAVSVSTTVLNNGASMLGVASLDEGAELRAAGIDAPILVMGYVPPWAGRRAIRSNLVVTLYDADLARALDRAARDLGTTLNAHVLVDSGRGTLGLLPDDVTAFFRALRTLEHITIEGVYTELAASDHNPDLTARQLAVFENTVDPLLAAGFRFTYIHAANSTAAIHIPEARFNLVRAGIALYGLSPGPNTPIPADFRPALTWKTTLAQIKRLPSGSLVGDGGSHRVQGRQIIGLIPVGFADGFRRAPHHWRHVLIRGEFVPVIGAVDMNLAAIDITLVPDVQPGDEVVLIGSQGDKRITVGDVAEFLSTTPYEVITAVMARVPRVR